jgi:hypothetical protein
MPFSTLKVILQQIGKIIPVIKLLIIKDLIKSPEFALFSSGGRLFHFKGSISVKKRGCSHCFCPKVPLLDKNPVNIYCSK